MADTAPPAMEAQYKPYAVPGKSYVMADAYQGVTRTDYCELRVYADKDGYIDHFAIAIDSMGKWSPSRCQEVFW